ncbi:hypothetical protein M433DRAFT_6527 [Acidomyces richmondensis BFW]|nr:hypothetical protein M433DRAFT_6527 [Acidomyces richmondensis BFW]
MASKREEGQLDEAKKEVPKGDSWGYPEDATDVEVNAQISTKSQTATNQLGEEASMSQCGSPNFSSTESDDSLLDIDYRSNLPIALENQEADMMARCLSAAAAVQDFDFIAEIDQHTFSQILRLMEPAEYVGRLMATHIELSDSIRQRFGIDTLYKIAWEHFALLSKITAIRESAKCSLTLDDYASLLRSGRDLGHFEMVRIYWEKLLSSGYLPSTQHWNYYLAGMLEDRTADAFTRRTLRVIPFNMVPRRQEKLGRQFVYRIGAGGIHEKITRWFHQMIKDGAPANEETFCILMTAAAREGDLGVVKSILLKVWNIDVDALLQGTEESKIRPKDLPQDSPQHPTSKLLFALAHVFSINNDVPTALRTVDFVARHYNLEIDQSTWTELFDWTFVLATARSGTHARDRNIGQLPSQSVVQLWDTMTGAPYFVQPTMSMYNGLIKNLLQRKMTLALIQRMEDGRQVHLKDRKQENELWTALLKKTEEKNRQTHTSGESLERLRDDWLHQHLILKRNHFWLKRWLRHVLGSMRSTVRFDASRDMALRIIPSMLWRWRAFTSQYACYETVGGLVEIEMHTKEEIQASVARNRDRRASQQRVLDQVRRYVGHSWVLKPP